MFYYNIYIFKSCGILKFKFFTFKKLKDGEWNSDFYQVKKSNAWSFI